MLAAAGLLGAMFPALAGAQVSPAQLLDGFRPMQKDVAVDYDTPADKPAIDACKVESIPTGYALRDAQGRLLRRFVDTNGKKDAQGKTHLDRWSYYKDGFEVYREVDLDEDGSLDECLWLNSGGSKVAKVQGNKIVGWSRLSAEEASRVLVQGLVGGNARVIETLMATPEDLAALGVPAAEVERAKKARDGRTAELEALRKGLVGWDAKTAWMRFDGSMPHVIPADAGLKADLLLYENAFVFAGVPGSQEDPMKVAYLQVPELVRVGETWKFAGLPRAVNPKEPVAAVADTGIRASLFRQDAGAPAASDNPELQKALDAIAQLDAAAPAGASKPDVAQYHYKRIALLRDALKLATTDDDRLNYNKQVVDSLAAAYQTGLYAAGAGVLDKYGEMAGPIASYAAYRRALAEFALAVDQPGAEYIKEQKGFVGKLEGFLAKHPKSDEAADVLFQLASINEFNADEDKARTYYARLAADFPQSQPGKKAAGALRRLDLVGKPLELTGAGLDGKPVSTDGLRGKTLLVAFWTTVADPVRRDLPELVKVYEKYRGKGLEIVGVSLDADRAAVDGFLKESPLPWSIVHEPGGMDSRLADEFGIISLPTMILTDASGKVVNRNIRTAAELDRMLERMFATAGGGTSVTLGGNAVAEPR
jgi:thiol-disulfide isomerase/thioredoxin